MSKLIDILVNDKLITDIALVEKAKNILSNKSYDDLLKLVNFKHLMVSDLNFKYNENVDNLADSDLSEDLKQQELNDIVIDYFRKRKELEYRFVTQLN